MYILGKIDVYFTVYNKVTFRNNENFINHGNRHHNIIRYDNNLRPWLSSW